jgi:GNAT superfamily N-acetyltransferase
VQNGASVGFLWPLDRVAVAEYWRQVIASLGDDFFLWVAEADERVVGTVQLARCTKQNGRHRAEVQKLFVHSAWRSRGIASQLLAAAEAGLAKSAARSSSSTRKPARPPSRSTATSAGENRARFRCSPGSPAAS